MITKYEDMTIGLYKRVMDIIDAAEDGDLEVTARVVAALAGLTEDEVMNLPLDRFAELNAKAAFLYEQPRPSRMAREYRIGGWVLRPLRDARAMTFGQFIDWQTVSARGGDNLAELLSVALVPQGRIYGRGYDIVALQRDIRESLPITDALAVLNFFLKRSAASRPSTLRSLDRTVRRAKRMLPEREAKELAERWASLRSGAGCASSTLQLRLPAAAGMLQMRNQRWSALRYSAIASTGTPSRSGSGSLPR